MTTKQVIYTLVLATVACIVLVLLLWFVYV